MPEVAKSIGNNVINDWISYVIEETKNIPFGWILGGVIVLGGIIYYIYYPAEQKKDEKKSIDKKDPKEWLFLKRKIKFS